MGHSLLVVAIGVALVNLSTGGGFTRESVHITWCEYAWIGLASNVVFLSSMPHVVVWSCSCLQVGASILSGCKG